MNDCPSRLALHKPNQLCLSINYEWGVPLHGLGAVNVN
jgi:hypothetical protein